MSGAMPIYRRVGGRHPKPSPTASIKGAGKGKRERGWLSSESTFVRSRSIRGGGEREKARRQFPQTAEIEGLQELMCYHL